MKNLALVILSLGLLAPVATSSAAEVSVVTADLNRLFENYYRTAEAESRFQSAVESAQSSAQSMIAEGQALVEEYEKMAEEAQSPALSAEARERLQAEAAAKLQTIQEKRMEVQQFQANTQRALEQRQQSHRQLMLDEIREAVKVIAQKHNANLVLDSSTKLGGIGTRSVLFADASLDITDEVLQELNKNQPKE